MTDAATTVSLSLNEVEGATRKAAKGAGYPWGLADVAASAARGLVALHVDPLHALVSLFERRSEIPLANVTPVSLGDIWQSKSVYLCPIICAAAMCDLARDLPQHGWALNHVLYPVLMVPAMADMARISSQTITLSWHNGLISMSEDGPSPSVGIKKLAQATVADVHIHSGGSQRDATPPAARAIVDAADWARLNAIAARTYAPATQASRLAGAGAGLSDND